MLDPLVLSSVQVVESITETCKVMASLSYRDNASSSYREIEEPPIVLSEKRIFHQLEEHFTRERGNNP